MQAFWMGLVAAVLIAAVAGVVLTSTNESIGQRTTATNTRL